MSLLVGLALLAGVGALGRYFLSFLNQSFSLPLGTLVVNCLASLILAYATKTWANEPWLPMVTVGLVGGLGTYSSVQLELLDLASHKKRWLVYFLLSYLGGLFMIYLGFSL